MLKAQHGTQRTTRNAAVPLSARNTEEEAGLSSFHPCAEPCTYLYVLFNVIVACSTNGGHPAQAIQPSLDLQEGGALLSKHLSAL